MLQFDPEYQHKLNEASASVTLPPPFEPNSFPTPTPVMLDRKPFDAMSPQERTVALKLEKEMERKCLADGTMEATYKDGRRILISKTTGGIVADLSEDGHIEGLHCKLYFEEILGVPVYSEGIARAAHEALAAVYHNRYSVNTEELEKAVNLIREYAQGPLGKELLKRLKEQVKYIAGKRIDIDSLQCFQPAPSLDQQ